MSKTIALQLQRNTPTQSATGQPVASFATYATVMAEIRALNPGAYYAAQQIANTVDVEVAIHYRTDVTAADRAIMGGVTYDLAAPPENVRLKNRKLILRLRHVE